MKKLILDKGPIGFQLPTQSPYIFNAHHLDYFPEGNEKMEPVNYLSNRHRGNDFDVNAPWRMYHGNKVPGFPVHPHRGFETITVVEQGFIDHFDSQGACGRYGEGDVQWMTAGAGIQHCEMFPLIHKDRENTLELFQIWLNLPRNSKMVNSHYKMLWNESIPVVKHTDENGKHTQVKVIAGHYGEDVPPSPPPDSWAYNQDHHVAIWIITMEPGAVFTLPDTVATAGRMLYFYRGMQIEIDGTTVSKNSYLKLTPDAAIQIINGDVQSKLLLLEGDPIQEPVAARGPFVMNTDAEIMQAHLDYQRTQFGGWPWDREDPLNPPDAGRFALMSNGHTEYPDK